MDLVLGAKLLGAAAVVAGLVVFKMTWDNNQQLKADKLILETQAKVNAENLDLFEKMINENNKTEAAAAVALSELTKDVPDAVQLETLDPSIQGVIDRFHRSVR